jgi:predicted Zn-dependent protease
MMFLVCQFLASAMCRATEPDVQPAGYNQFTVEDETRIGAALVRDFESHREILANVLLDKYLAGVTERLGKASRRPELTYTCKVVNSHDVNAFSFPGGAVYVTTGLLDYVQDESELASVLAHEIGHIAARHLMNRLSLEVRSKALWDQARSMLPSIDLTRRTPICWAFTTWCGPDGIRWARFGRSTACKARPIPARFWDRCWLPILIRATEAAP